MTRARLLRSLAAVLLLALSGVAGCSFMVDFDYAGKPCSSTGTCLADYVCVNGTCEPADEVGLDAGKHDGGSRDGAEVALDAALPTDAAEDSGTGAPDVFYRDASIRDASIRDASIRDASLQDGGARD